MHIDDYQILAQKTSKFVGKNGDFTYPILGILGELGEVCRELLNAVEKQALVLHGPNTKEYSSYITNVTALLEKMEIYKKEMRIGALSCSAKISDIGDIENFKKSLILEIGDVMWYMAALATVFDFKLSEVLNANIVKLSKRHNVAIVEETS